MELLNILLYIAKETADVIKGMGFEIGSHPGLFRWFQSNYISTLMQTTFLAESERWERRKSLKHEKDSVHRGWLWSWRKGTVSQRMWVACRSRERPSARILVLQPQETEFCQLNEQGNEFFSIGSRKECNPEKNLDFSWWDLCNTSDYLIGL